MTPPNKYAPSAFALKALGVQPKGEETAMEDGYCKLCGFSIKEGEPATYYPFHGASSFMDEFNLACRESNMACQWCTPAAVVNSARVLRKVHSMVFTKKAAYPINKDVNRSWFLLTPPEPPYMVVVKSINNTQHLIWRGTITLDNEQIVVRFGPSLFTIRHSVLMSAVSLCSRAGDLMRKYSKKENKTIYTHPFQSLDRDVKRINHGVISSVAWQIAVEVLELREILEELRWLTAGELWALATLVKKEKAIPKKPEPIVI